MPLHPTSQLLVDTLRNLPLFDRRFANLRLANYDAFSGQRGSFSLVFRADDVIEGRRVALKFFDPAKAMSQYRLAAFARECTILQALMNVQRCLQLEKAITDYSLVVPGGGGLTFPCQYFAVEWLEADIDHYFLGKANDPIEKLRLFNDIVLAVEALHRHEVFHRDLKVDNLRESGDALKRMVIAIDLGTAARFESKNIEPGYDDPVGAWQYSAAEARCGLAGNRQLAPSTDAYALGCLLFELFNRDYFFRSLYANNPTYDGRLAAMRAEVVDHSSDEAEIVQWTGALSRFAGGVAPISIAGPGSAVPPGVVEILDELLSRLTHFDYRTRPKLHWVRQKLQIAVRVLSNQKAYDERRRRSRELREWRLRKAAARAQKRLTVAHERGEPAC